MRDAVARKPLQRHFHVDPDCSALSRCKPLQYGGDMKSIDLKSVITLSDGNHEELITALGCSEDQLAGELRPFVTAALSEYIEMFTGAASMTTATDLKERRLVAIIRHAFAGRMPSAVEVSKLFNITQSQAATLLKNVVAKHRLKLESSVQKALKAAFEAAERDPKHKADLRYYLVANDATIVRILNEILAQADSPKTSVRPIGDSLNRYAIDPGSYKYLKEQLSNEQTDTQ
jgi:hypothetical protein